MSKRALRLVPLVALISGTVAAQTPAGPEFQVNTYTTGAQVAESSAMAKDGSFVIVWTASDPVARADVFARRYDPAGLAQGTEFRVNTQTTAHHRTARVASRPAGDFVIVWGRHSPQTGISFGVYGQRYTAGGLALGGEFRVNTYTSGSSSAQEPSVAMADDGRFVVVWDSFRTDGSSSQVMARLYDRSGNARGGEIAVNTWTSGPQSRPAVASDAHGNFTVVWPGEGIGDPYGIFARRFNGDGQPQGLDIRVNTTTSFLQFNPSHAMAPAGDFVVVWQSVLSNNYIQNFAQRFDAGGNRAGGQFPLSNVGDDGRPAVGVDAAGDFVVAWDAGFTGSQDVYGRRYRAGPRARASSG